MTERCREDVEKKWKVKGSIRIQDIVLDQIFNIVEGEKDLNHHQKIKNKGSDKLNNSRDKE